MAAAPPEHAHPEEARRRAAMALCAQAGRAELDRIVADLAGSVSVEDLRPPETGLVMLRGRVGGDGGPFNLGEATVTRAAIRIASGETGFAYHLGRDVPKARAAAILDALWQSARRAAVERALAPIEARLRDKQAKQDRRTAATRVNFFTLVRGED